MEKRPGALRLLLVIGRRFTQFHLIFPAAELSQVANFSSVGRFMAGIILAIPKGTDLICTGGQHCLQACQLDHIQIKLGLIY